jgi:hypothetical protein
MLMHKPLQKEKKQENIIYFVLAASQRNNIILERITTKKYVSRPEKFCIRR